MGTAISKFMLGREKRKRYQRRLNKQLEKYKRTIDGLGMSMEDAKLLYLFFTDVDEDGSGEVDVTEFFRYLGLKQTVFARRTFTMFDADGSGEIDFREFLVALFSYCTADKTGLISFAFRLYDTDNSGMLDITEIQQLIREVYGDDFKNSIRAKNVMEKLNYAAEKNPRFANPDGEVSEPVFSSFTRANPALLFPAFQLQVEIQERVMGNSYWKRQAKRRAQLEGFSGLDDFQAFMKEVQEDAFRELAESGRLDALDVSDQEDEAEERAPAPRQTNLRARSARLPRKGGAWGKAHERKMQRFQSNRLGAGGRPNNKKLRLLRKRDLEEQAEAKRQDTQQRLVGRGGRGRGGGGRGGRAAGRRSKTGADSAMMPSMDHRRRPRRSTGQQAGAEINSNHHHQHPGLKSALRTSSRFTDAPQGQGGGLLSSMRKRLGMAKWGKNRARVAPVRYQVMPGEEDQAAEGNDVADSSGEADVAGRRVRFSAAGGAGGGGANNGDDNKPECAAAPRNPDAGGASSRGGFTSRRGRGTRRGRGGGNARSRSVDASASQRKQKRNRRQGGGRVASLDGFSDTRTGRRRWNELSPGRTVSG